MKTKTVKQMQMQVWQANAERSRLSAELKAAGIAREMISAHVARLTFAVEAAARFVQAQAPLVQGELRLRRDFAGDEFNELERALSSLVGGGGAVPPGAGTHNQGSGPTPR